MLLEGASIHFYTILHDNIIFYVHQYSAPKTPYERQVLDKLWCLLGDCSHLSASTYHHICDECETIVTPAPSVSADRMWFVTLSKSGTPLSTLELMVHIRDGKQSTASLLSLEYKPPQLLLSTTTQTDQTSVNMEATQNHQEIIGKMRVLDRKFRHSCRQIMLLNHRIKDEKMRYSRAYKGNQRSWRYTLRLQLATLEGMKNVYYEYAYRRADELEALQDQLVAEGLMSDSEEDLDWSEEV